MSSADAPSAAVRTITPPFFGAISLRIAFRRVALVVLEAPRDAEALAVRDVDDEATGQRDLGRQAGALRLHRVLDRLDEHVLAALDQILDLPRASAALELGADDLVDVEEAVLLEADLDERGLHPRQDVVDDAEVDVAGDRAALGPLEVDLGDLVVLEHGDALLARVDGDEQLALRLRQRRALRRADGGAGLEARVFRFSAEAGLPLASTAVAALAAVATAAPAAAAPAAGLASGCALRACRDGASSGRLDFRRRPRPAPAGRASVVDRFVGVRSGGRLAAPAVLPASCAGTSAVAKMSPESCARASLRMRRASRVVGKSLGMACPTNGISDRRARTAYAASAPGELGAPRPDRTQPLRETRPRPGLDLEYRSVALPAGRLEVLEPRVRLLDQQQLDRFLVAGQAHAASPPVRLPRA